MLMMVVLVNMEQKWTKVLKVKSQIGFEAKFRIATDRTSLTRLTKFSDVAYLKSALICIYFVFDIPVEK